MRWPVSLFRGARDPEPKPAEWNWYGLTHALTVPRVEPDKLRAPAWSPARYKPGARRGAAGVVEVSCLVLDYDEGAPIEAARDAWKGYRAIVHTSWSHTPEHPKFRYVLPLVEPVTAAVWPAVYRWAWKRSQGADKSCSDPSRLYFLPSIRRGGWPYEATTVNPVGPLLDLGQVEVREQRKPRVWKRVEVQPRRLDKELRRRLREDPSLRRRVGEELGGKVAGEFDERIVGIVCPNCARPDVWFPLAPRGKGAAHCNHTNSCGWWGWLEDLWYT